MVISIASGGTPKVSASPFFASAIVRGTGAAPSPLADPGGDVLGEEFGELAELEERRVGVVGEVALGEEAEAHQLFVVRAEHGEVGRGRVHGRQVPVTGSIGCGCSETAGTVYSDGRLICVGQR